MIAGYVLSQEGKKWTKLWYQIKQDLVLYKFRAHEVCYLISMSNFVKREEREEGSFGSTLALQVRCYTTQIEVQYVSACMNLISSPLLPFPPSESPPLLSSSSLIHQDIKAVNSMPLPGYIVSPVSSGHVLE